MEHQKGLIYSLRRTYSPFKKKKVAHVNRPQKRYQANYLCESASIFIAKIVANAQYSVAAKINPEKMTATISPCRCQGL